MKKKLFYLEPTFMVSKICTDMNFCLSGSFASNPEEVDESGEDWGYNN